ncbi:MAG: diguanylate cyclase [Chloroflexota bacterium]
MTENKKPMPEDYINQLQQRVHELEKIMDIGRELTAKRSLNELLKKILVTASDLVASEVASIILNDTETGELHIRVSFQPASVDDVVELNIPVPLDNSIAGEVFKTGKPIIVEDAAADKRHFKKIDVETGYETHNLIGVPLRSGKLNLGVLMVTNKADGEPFNLSDQEILVVLGSHAAVSIENARLYTELHAYANELEERVSERTQDLKTANENLELEIEVRIRAEEELARLARTAPLTELNNRRHFFELGEQEFGRADRYNYQLSVMMIDIDHFKNINDTHGHFAGDQVLRAAGKILMKTMREVDIYGRYGGEEFVVLLPETDATQSLKTADRIRAAFEIASIPTDAGDLKITASLGLASLTPEITTLDALLDNADTALYQAKENGRNQVKIWRKE